MESTDVTVTGNHQQHLPTLQTKVFCILLKQSKRGPPKSFELGKYMNPAVPFNARVAGTFVAPNDPSVLLGRRSEKTSNECLGVSSVFISAA